MAVTLTVDDLLYPSGEMQPVMFPDGDVEIALVLWLNEAMTLATDNAAAAHYVYYRGYNAAANRIAATPSSESTGMGSHSVSWSDSRVKALRDLANYHKAEFDKGAETAGVTQPRAFFGRASVG
jgi:hypothetical protein